MGEGLQTLIGNDEQKERLLSAARAGTLAHAFLLCGPEGSGRHTFAREIAAALNCASRTDSTRSLPCRTCSACRRIASGQFPDIFVLRREEDKLSIGVDEVRAMREDMFLSPTEADGKVYIIEHAESLTIQAQNALLKVLEEPPRRVTVFLLTDALSPILTTVKSRTQILRMQHLSDEVMREAIQEHARQSGVYLTEQAIATLLRRADGILGQALASIDPKTIEKEEKQRQTVVDLLRGCTTNTSFRTIQQAVGAFGVKRRPFEEGAMCVLRAVRDLLAIKRDEDAPLLFFPDRDTAAQLSRSLSVKTLFRLYDSYNAALSRVSINANMTLVIAQLCADIKQKA